MEDLEALKAKYGGLPKQRLIVKEKKCFDSADWALDNEAKKGKLGKQGKKGEEGEEQPDSIRAAPIPEVHIQTEHTGSNLRPTK